MRIGFNGRFLSAPKITGVERYALNIWEQLIKLDNQNEYIMFGIKDRKDINIQLGSNASYVECNIPFTNSIFKHIWEQFNLPLMVKKYDCDMLFNPINTAPLFINGKSILVLHDISFVINPSWFSKSFRYLYGKFSPVMAKRADKIITVSESSKNDIMRYLNIESSKIAVVYNGISDTFNPDSRTNNLSWSKQEIQDPYILFAGSLNPRKNLIKLIKAFNLMKQRSSIHYKLVIVGASGKNFNDMEVCAYEDFNDIIWVGYVDDDKLKSLYKNADLFVFPSLYEGFGFPPLEAMASGCPVVVANTSSLPEVCGDAACYVNPYSIESIAAGMGKVLNDAAYRDGLKQRGYVQAKKYNWTNSASAIIKIFEEVYNETRHYS